MKLHVGCGPLIKEGYKHQDVVNLPHIDYNSVAWSINEADNSFDEIFSRHFFEHLHPWEAQDTLKEWCRVLTSDGMIVMSLPNLEFHIKQFNMPGNSEILPAKTNMEHAMASIYGWPNRERPWMAHGWGYTAHSLRVLLMEYFSDIQFQPCRKCDLSVIAKGKLQ